jgi:hypothetical protein
MEPDASKKSALIYAGDGGNGGYYEVDVYDYATGKRVGVLIGFDIPYGMCVDAEGDVYIANYYRRNVVEFAHGGSKVINTYKSGGRPIGCSVDAKGDLAVTSLLPGEAIIYARGNPSKSTTHTSPCTTQQPMGYDDKGNLVGLGTINYVVSACALLSGSKSMTTLSGCCGGPITIHYPGGTMWDGKYLALSDLDASGHGSQTGIVRAAVSGTMLVSHGETVPQDDCYGSGAYLRSPFIVGKKNMPVNHEQGKTVVGSDENYGCGGIEFWHYPAGGLPFKRYALRGTGYHDLAVSLKP